jgi:hypothetical protein
MPAAASRPASEGSLTRTDNDGVEFFHRITAPVSTAVIRAGSGSGIRLGACAGNPDDTPPRCTRSPRARCSS